MRTGPKGIDWLAVPDLGQVADRVIAERLGVHRASVAMARHRLGIPYTRTRDTAPKRIDWTLVPLGQKPDRVIAAELGVTKEAVRFQRKKRGIAASWQP